MHAKSDSISLLLQYLRDVLDCESRLLALHRASSLANSRISELQQELSQIARPTKPTRHVAVPKLYSKYEECTTLENLILLPLAAIFAISMFGGLIVFIAHMDSNMPLVGFAVSVIGLALLELSRVLRIKRYKEKASADAEAKADSDFQQAQIQYLSDKQEMEKQLKRIESDLHWLTSQVSDLSKHISKTEPILNSLYAQGILHYNYRNITAVASILDYVSTGRTESLTRSGPDPGAYNIYEDDIRAGRIVNAIDVGFNRMGTRIENAINDIGNMIDSKLDGAMQKLQENQQSLYSAINEGNSILKLVSTDVGTMNSAISENNVISKGLSNNSRILVDLNRDFYGNLRDRGGHHVDEN